MTIETVTPTDVKDLFDQLEQLSLNNSNIVFRGHRDASWRIQSTLARYTTMPMRSYVMDLEENLLYFMYKISSLRDVPFNVLSRRAVLEFARHHGIPTPVIDFTWSPYVAAYFAFGGIQWRHGSASQNAAILALDVSNLAHGWAKIFGNRDNEYQEFMYENNDFFSSSYPADMLKFVQFPASWNRRMQSQQGCFVYDSLDYKSTGRWSDFEDFVEAIDEPTSATTSKKEPTVKKFLIPHSSVSAVLAKLEMTNISGINLLDHDGIASDVMSTYNHNRKIGYTWDMELK